MAASAHDVAAYVLGKRGNTTAMMLQKLLYYCQAWSLAWDARPLFAGEFQAWAKGPVMAELWAAHKGALWISAWPSGDPSRLTGEQLAVIDVVLDLYGPLEPGKLSDLTHRERPWRDARRGIGAGERSGATITHASMRAYYSAGAEPGRRAISEAFKRGMSVLLQMPEEDVDALTEELDADPDDPLRAKAAGDKWPPESFD